MNTNRKTAMVTGPLGVLLGSIAVLMPSALGAIAGVALMTALVANPPVGILGLLLLRPMVDQAESLFGLTGFAGQSPSALFGLGILGSSFFIILGLQGRKRLSDWAHPWWMFALYVFVLGFFAYSISYGVGIAGRVLSWTMLASVILLIPDGRLLSVWVPRIAALASLVIVVSAGVGYVVAPRAFYGAGEVVGFFYNPQGLAFPLLLMIPALLIGVGRQDRWRNICLAAMSFATGIVFMSLSRTAWLALVVLATTSFQRLRDLSPRSRRSLLFSIFASVAIVAVAAYLRRDAVAVRLSDMQAGVDVAAFGSGRGAIYGAILTSFLAAPPLAKLVGSGLGASLSVTTAALGSARVAHSDLIWILYETGVLGLSLFLIGFMRVWFALVRAARRTKSEWAAAALSATAAMLCLALFNGVVTDGSMTYYAVILGLGLRSALRRLPGGAEA